MKRMRKVGMALAGLAVAAAFGFTSAMAEGYIYQPNMPDNPNPDSLGAGADFGAPFQTNLTEAVWQAHYGAAATANPDVTNWDQGYVQGAVAVLIRCSTNNPYRQQNAILWTDNFSVTNQDVQKLSEIMFQQNNQHTTVTPRVALRIGGEWFVSVNTYGQAVEGAQERTTLNATALASMNWYALDFTAGSELVVDDSSTIAFSALSGDVDAAGLYYPDMGTNRVRLREFTIKAVRDPIPGMIIYRPAYSPANLDSLGNGSSDSGDIFPLSNVGWQCHFGETGTFNDAGVDQKTGFVQGHVALINNNVTTNQLRTTPPTLLWTDQMAVADRDVQELTGITVVQQNAQDTIKPQLALRVGGEWVVGSATLEHAAGVITTKRIYAEDMEAMTWYPLAFVEDVELSLDTADPLDFASLTGAVDAFGFYYGTGALGTARARIREVKVQAEAQPIAGVYIYRPAHWSENLNSLGHGGEAAEAYPVGDIGWQCHFGETGLFNDAGDDQFKGFVQGHVALLNYNSTTNELRTTPPALLWTGNFSATDRDVQELTGIMFLQNNHQDTMKPQLALRVDGQWYVSVQTFEHESGATVRTELYPHYLNWMSWYPLDFTPGVTLSLDTEETVAFSDLSGAVDAAGFYYGAGALGTHRARIREFTIQAEGDPLPDTVDIVSIDIEADVSGLVVTVGADWSESATLWFSTNLVVNGGGWQQVATGSGGSLVHINESDSPAGFYRVSVP